MSVIPRTGVIKTVKNSFFKTGGFSRAHNWVLWHWWTLLKYHQSSHCRRTFPLCGISFLLVVHPSGKLWLSTQICNHSPNFLIDTKKRKLLSQIVKPAKLHIHSQAQPSTWCYADNSVEMMRALCYGGTVSDKRPIFQPIIMWVAVILSALLHVSPEKTVCVSQCVGCFP